MFTTFQSTTKVKTIDNPESSQRIFFVRLTYPMKALASNLYIVMLNNPILLTTGFSSMPPQNSRIITVVTQSSDSRVAEKVYSAQNLLSLKLLVAPNRLNMNIQ